MKRPTNIWVRLVGSCLAALSRPSIRPRESNPPIAASNGKWILLQRIGMILSHDERH